MSRALFYALFVIIGGTILFLAHRCVWRRLAKDTALSGVLRTIVTGVFLAGGLLIPITMAIRRVAPRETVQPMAVAAFLWLGALFYLALLLAPWDVRRLVTWVARRGWRRKKAAAGDADAPAKAHKQEAPVEEEPAQHGRRIFLSRVAAGTAVVGTTGFMGLGVRSALADITKPEVEVKLPRLPKELSGLRIVQISDVHIGPILDKRFLSSVVAEINALKPDLVAVTGDLVDAPVRLIGPDLAPLSRIEARYGAYFVTGNHEYYSEVDGWVPYLRKLGLRVLMNDRVSVGDAGPRGASLDLVGVPDPQAHRFGATMPDLKAAVAGRDPERELVLLAHRPNHITEAAEHDVGLQISGHTHGGQIWPFGALAALTTPYLSGLHHHEETTHIYVSRGTGFWGPPMRVLAPAEITSIVLTA